MNDPTFPAPGQAPYQQPYGHPGYPPLPYPVPARASGRAITVLVLGIGSLVGFFLLGAVLAVVALCLAPGAKKEIAQSNGTLTGDGMVLAGKVCSWISIAFTVVGIVLFLGLFAVGASMSTIPEPTFVEIPG